LQGLITELGLDAVFVENGLEAVNLLRKENFDAVLMDNRMPVMDGFQATRAIRDANTGVLDSQIYIVAVTANASANYRDECLAAGMNDFLTKPLRKRELVAALGRGLNLAGRTLQTNNIIENAHSSIQGMTEAELLAMIEDDKSLDREEIEMPHPGAPLTVIRMYLQETPLRIEEMRAGLNQGDFQLLGRAAHTLKGNSHYVAGYELSRLGDEIEKRADVGNPDGILLLINEVENKFVELKHSLWAGLEEVP
jgi:CheY-like chemotaxis protein/HPt (histidine-containing phosphotransfer) domain-containing protein